MTRRDLLLLLILFIVTRSALTVVGVAAMVVLPSVEGDEYTHLIDASPALDMWYRQDAGFYTSIATYGYDWQNERRPADDMAYLPVFPLLVRAVSGLSPTGCAASPYLSTCATIGGLIVSNLALFAALVLLFDLARRRFDKPTAWRTALLLMLSPISIFLSGVYTESVFLMLSVLVFWLLDRDAFWLALIVACLASLTRSVGIALAVPLFITAWRMFSIGRAPRRKAALRVIASALPVFILAGYILGIGAFVGEPLAYFSTNAAVWDRQAGSVIEAFTMYFSGEDVSLFGWRLSWIDFGATLAFLGLAALTLRRDLRLGSYALGVVLISIASGSLVSMPRYGAVIFPFYLLIGMWSYRRWRLVVVLGVSVALWLLFVTRFVTWNWIA